MFYFRGNVSTGGGSSIPIIIYTITFYTVQEIIKTEQIQENIKSIITYIKAINLAKRKIMKSLGQNYRKQTQTQKKREI